MKSISVGELRQNPSAMIEDVVGGEIYELTRHSQRVGLIVPAVSSSAIIPRSAAGPARTTEIPRHQLRTAASVDDLIAEDEGDW